MAGTTSDPEPLEAVPWYKLFVKLHLNPPRQNPTRIYRQVCGPAASRLADLVAKYRGIPAEAVERLSRVLSDRDFIFRGGGPATA